MRARTASGVSTPVLAPPMLPTVASSANIPEVLNSSEGCLNHAIEPAGVPKSALWAPQINAMLRALNWGLATSSGSQRGHSRLHEPWRRQWLRFLQLHRPDLLFGDSHTSTTFFTENMPFSQARLHSGHLLHGGPMVQRYPEQKHLHPLRRC